LETAATVLLAIATAPAMPVVVPIAASCTISQQAVEALQEVVPDIFLTMAGMDAQPGAEYINRHGAGSGRKVAGIIGWVGNWNGTGIFECSPEFACQLTNAMLGTQVDSVNEDSLDAVAEITNIIFGSMKTRLESTLGVTGLSTPTVIFGNDVGMRSSGDAFTVVPIQIGEDSIQLKVYIIQMEEKRRAFSHFWAASCSGAL
jgi:chemotaxis protein CheX